MTDFSSIASSAHNRSGQPLGPRSQLVTDFFDHMNRHGVPWVVMNNYEDLPWVIPSDIDFSIPPELFHRLDSFVADFAQVSGARIVQKLWHGNMKCAYILAIGPEGAREFVQLDFFTAFSTKGCPRLIPHKELVGGRRALRNFYVPRPEVELIFTAMRRLFKDDWSARHCGRIAELQRRITVTDWLPRQYNWLLPTLEAAVRGDVQTVEARRAEDWARLRATAARNLSLSEKVSNALIQVWRIAVRLRDETGQLIVLAGPRGGLGDEALEKLELVFHRRVFWEGKAPAILPIRLAMLKRRKGLVFILAGKDHPEGKTLARRLGRMGLVDQVLYPEGNGSNPDLGMPATAFVTDAEAVEVTVKVQAAKAARAIARGGTQTSGDAT